MRKEAIVVTALNRLLFRRRVLFKLVKLALAHLIKQGKEMAQFRNRRSVATQIGLMMITLGNKPDINKIYRMSETAMKTLFSELTFQLKLKKESDNEMAK